jgi:hypothetical protein
LRVELEGVKPAGGVEHRLGDDAGRKIVAQGGRVAVRGLAAREAQYESNSSTWTAREFSR